MLLLVGTAAAFSLGSATATAASSASTDDTEVGDAAALVVLGASDDVQRPSTASDLAVSLGGAFEDGALPSSYALEVTPYWLAAGKSTSLLDYARGGFPSLLRNANASLAITSSSADGAAAALALRTTYWGSPGPNSRTAIGRFVNGYPKVFSADPTQRGTFSAADADSTCLQTLARLSDFSAGIAASVAAKLEKDQKAKMDAATEAATALLTACADVDPSALPESATLCSAQPAQVHVATGAPLNPDLDAATKARITSLAAAVERANTALATALDKTTDKVLTELKTNAGDLEGELGSYLGGVAFEDAFEGCTSLLTRREGFAMDFALGLSVVSPDETVAALDVDRFRAWVAPGWIREAWSLFFLGRLTVDDLGGTPAPSVDLGAGVGHTWSRLTLSLQGSGRLPVLGADPAARVTVGGDVQLAQGVWFTTTVGGSFPFDEEGSLITLAGLKLGVNQERTLATPTATELATIIP